MQSVNQTSGPPRSTSLTDPDQNTLGTGLGSTRTRVLSLLQDNAAAMSAAEVAERIGLHVNTARFHLEGLEQAGLAERRTEDRETPGRPRALYLAREEAPEASHRSYRLLAEILTSYLTDRLPKPQESAEEAGQAWGRYLAEPAPPFRRVPAGEAVRALVDQLGEVGFESQITPNEEGSRLDIHHCPFLEVAADHREVVCSVHLGLMRGMLTQMRAPVTAESLEPLVGPSHCVAHLHPSG